MSRHILATFKAFSQFVFFKNDIKAMFFSNSSKFSIEFNEAKELFKELEYN